jgi:hypothetical protein
VNIKLACFDLETTGTDVATTQVVQVAMVRAQWNPNGSIAPARLDILPGHVTLCHASSIPKAATSVHRITAEQVADVPPFEQLFGGLVAALTEPDTYIVTFNGLRFDLPIVAEYCTKQAYGGGLGDLRSRLGVETWTDEHGRVGFFDAATTRAAVDTRAAVREAILSSLRTRHVDVFRLWKLAQSRSPIADCFTGKLSAAHYHLLGTLFDGAHDAAVDCAATLRVLDALLAKLGIGIDDAVRFSNRPLPGLLDMDGSLAWEGDVVVLTFGKYKGTALEDVPGSYLSWMVNGDFGADTKQVLRGYLSGDYPVRHYEDEV